MVPLVRHHSPLVQTVLLCKPQFKQGAYLSVGLALDVCGILDLDTGENPLHTPVRRVSLRQQWYEMVVGCNLLLCQLPASQDGSYFTLVA